MATAFYNNIKHTQFDGGDGLEPKVFILKKAGSNFKLPANVKMQPDMYDFVHSIKIDTDKYLYLLINAMGASEYYGSNLNGDWFDEIDLKQYHKTFEQGLVYLDHENSDPDKAVGKILFSSYNDKMHRVELLVAVDKSDPRSQRVINQISNGIMPRCSMGTRVPYDVCRLCGNKAATRSEYCEHARDHLGKLLPDGRRVAVSNPHPRFFEISLLSGTEADPSSGTMAKVASHIAAKLKEAKIDKESVIDKDVYDGEPAARDVSEAMATNKMLCGVGKEMDDAQEDLPDDLLGDMCQCFEPDEILGTMAGLNMKVRPREFTIIQMSPLSGEGVSGMSMKRLSIRHLPTEEAIKDAMSHPMPLRWSDGVASMLRPYVEKRSMTPGNYDPRLLVTNRFKGASTTQGLPTEKLANEYARYIGSVLSGSMCVATNPRQDLLMGKLSALSSSNDQLLNDWTDTNIIKMASTLTTLDLCALNILYGAYMR